MEVVCKKWTADFEANGYYIEDILSLIKEAYRERAKEGISFETLDFTLSDFLAERTESDYWFLAFDDDNKLYGTARLTIFDNNSGEVCNFAVLPQSQGKHIGSQLLQSLVKFGEEQKLDYIQSYTAIHAKSSVKCHCNNGFRIISIISRLTLNYSSYKFKYQIKNNCWWNNVISVKFGYALSYVTYRMKKKDNGQNTVLGNLVLRHKSKRFVL